MAKTMDDWDELAEVLSTALPCGVEVEFPGRDDDEDTDLRLIVDGSGNARLVIDLGDEDTAHSEETFYLEWGVHDDDEGWEEEADFTWQSSDWSRSGAGWTNEGDEALKWTMGDFAGDVVGTVLDMVNVLAGGEHDEGQILYNEEGHVEVDDNLRYVLASAYDKGAMDVRSFIREELLNDIDLQPEEGFADVHQDENSDWIFVNERSGRALSLDVDLRYPEDGGSRCMITRISSKNSDTVFVKRAANAMMSPEDYEEMRDAVDWLIDEDAEEGEE
jgi:hypothetical protein